MGGPYHTYSYSSVEEDQAAREEQCRKNHALYRHVVGVDEDEFSHDRDAAEQRVNAMSNVQLLREIGAFFASEASK